MGSRIRVGLFSPYFGSTVGGGESYLAETAAVIRDTFDADVEIVGAVVAQRERYEAALGVDLRDVGMAKTGGAVTPLHRALNRVPMLRPLRNLVLARRAARATATYDVVIAQVFRIPIRSSAPRGAVLCQFPHELRSPEELSGYQIFVAQSDYVAQWIRRRWGVEAAVVHPPVVLASRTPGPSDKRKVILSVGRFFRGGHAKRQDVLVQAFRALCDAGLTGWELHLAGSVHDAGPHRGYFQEVERLANGYPVRLHSNVPRDRLMELYAAASIYWHAAGFGTDVTVNPEAAEHFGMTTVEAMSWGVVPVVFAAGGQPEVVGQAGMTWTTLEELSEHTLHLTRDGADWKRRSRLAREASLTYGRETFRARMAEVLKPLFS